MDDEILEYFKPVSMTVKVKVSNALRIDTEMGFQRAVTLVPMKYRRMIGDRVAYRMDGFMRTPSGTWVTIIMEKAQ